MQAIHVKFLCPTDTRGSRYKAIAQAGSVTVHSDYALNPSDNAAKAALSLAVKLGWTGEMVGGGMPDGSYAFVFTAGDKVTA
jgi:hypothetical protein